jgi:hypothetical protein
VRCYIPYGGQWFAYFLGCVRRLPEGALRRWQRRRPPLGDTPTPAAAALSK